MLSRVSDREFKLALNTSISSAFNYSQLSMMVVALALEWNLKKKHNLYLHGKAPMSDFFPGMPVCQTLRTVLLGSPWIL